MSDIPLVKACYATSIADTLVGAGVPIAGLLRRARLSEEILWIPDGFIPFHNLHDFTAEAAQESAWFELGVAAGARPYGDYAAIGRDLLVAPTLYQALVRFCRKATQEDETAEFSLVKGRNRTWFCSKTTGWTEEGIRQCENFRYQLMLQMVRWVAGPAWLPKILAVQSADDGELRDATPFREVNVRFNSPVLAMAIENQLLIRTLPKDKHATRGLQLPERTLGAISNFEESLSEILRTLVQTGECKLADLSRITGISRRTLQRRLASLGLSFGELVEHVRFDLARDMLCNECLPISEIASQAGYRHATHFSRAFKRAFGVTPREYREASRSDS